MRLSPRSLAIVTVFTALAATRAGAAVTTAAEECSAITDDRERLECYDTVFGKPAGGGQQPVPAAAEAIAPAAGPVNPQADFGLTESAKAAREPDKARPRYPDSITDTVAAVGFKPTGELVVTLTNGQVWVQTDTVSFARVKAGENVTIRKGALGSYLLVTASHVITHVKRLQ
jgi:hypothetical protein